MGQTDTVSQQPDPEKRGQLQHTHWGPIRCSSTSTVSCKEEGPEYTEYVSLSEDEWEHHLVLAGGTELNYLIQARAL